MLELISPFSDLVEELCLDLQMSGEQACSGFLQQSPGIRGMPIRFLPSGGKPELWSCSDSPCPALCQLQHMSPFRNHPRFHILKCLWMLALHPRSEALAGI